VKKVLTQVQSEFQTIEVYETPSLGRLFALDSIVQTIDQFEFIYHEMLAHPAMYAHPNPETVLIIGGGDGGTLREALRHASVQKAVLCEIDCRVIEVAREWLPKMACSFFDPRAEIHVADGVAFLQKTDRLFDVIIIDSTDPTAGEGGNLFTEAFYNLCRDRLTAQGVLSAQTENPIYDHAWMKRAFFHIQSAFPNARIYTSPCPQYPSGYWCYTIASKGPDPLHRIPTERKTESLSLQYYTPEIHTASFALPPFLSHLLDHPL
jgi:spermidine synthase